ncbi:CAAX amino terminal protease self-immunity [Oceanobacillus picturae]|uniref:CAAX amino terminal protease self-immunity n=2 Tax=Oceanobacillus picturae TaxID=171693 RepID=A0A0U9HEF9_9BACI|nr:CAAX amino terminal protease self-immunity [Oceanobacillus picturae]
MGENMNKKMTYILLSGFFTCAVLAFIEHGIEINYVIKTACKISFFFIVVWVYMKLFKDFHFKQVLALSKMGRREWLKVTILGISSAGIVLAAYLLFLPQIDLNLIQQDLTDRLGITATGFIFVGIYVSFGNSLLEEYFFRGFIFFNLPRKWGYIYSPLLFASYHIPMIMLWFTAEIILICFIGLWVVGVVFHLVNEKNRTIWASWIIHICADLMIIIIGLNLFY